MRTQEVIQGFLNNRQAQNLSPKSIQWYQVLLTKFAQFHPELPLTPEPIERFLAQVKGCPETKHGYFRALKILYGFVCRRYSTKHHKISSPMEQIAPPRCPKKVLPTLEPAEMLHLINLVTNLRDKTLLTILIDTGARGGEIAGLRKQDIKNDSVTVSGKTGERETPISEETRRLLLSLAANGGSEYLFTSKWGRPLNKDSTYYIVRRLMTQAGIKGPKLGPHRLRHAFGKNYLVSGGDVRSLQEIMGHASITTTQKYATLALTDIIAKHHCFTPLKVAHAAAQESLFDTSLAVKEAEAILKKEETHGRP